MKQIPLNTEDVFIPNEAAQGDTWVDEVLLFSRGGKNEAVSDGATFMGARLSPKRSMVFLILIAFAIGSVIAKIGYIQLMEGDTYGLRADRNRQRIVPIEAERGLIYDRHGIELTKNIPNFTLTIRPQDIPSARKTEEQAEERQRLISTLARITEQNEEDVAATLKEYGSYSYESIAIKEDLDYERALEVEIAAAELPGVAIRRGSKRLYLEPGEENTSLTTSSYSLGHVLGYLGKLTAEELDDRYDVGYLPTDNIGKVGVERAYETQLRGVHGRRRVEVDARGREQTIISEDAPSPGQHLKLTIDAEIQGALEESMRKYMGLQGKHRASAVAVDPNSGQILALISLPGFDNNDFSGGITRTNYNKYIENEHRPLFARAIGGTYPSGSVIKPAVTAAALTEGIVSKTTSFLSNGGVRVGQWFFPDWKAGGHGITNARKAIADSVNTYYYIVGGGYNDFVGLGVAKIRAYLTEFGFGKTLGIDIPGEAKGFIPSKSWKEEAKGERWYVGDTYNLSIGQGDLLVTPLQIAMMTGAIANGGTLYKPHLAQSFINPLSGEEKTVEEEVLNEQFIPPAHLETVRLGMRDCVTVGSCRRLNILEVFAAGKTGTAQWSNQKEPHAWFTSFAPYDSPEIVLTVLVEEGEGGSTIAVPIAYDFYRWWQGYRRE